MELDFYNHNAGIAYPFLDIPGNRRVGALEWRDDAVLDCGFVVERQAGVAGLTQIVRVGPDLVYRFLLDGLTAEVPVPADAEPGTVTRAGGDGWDGFIVTGPGHAVLADLHNGARQTLAPSLQLEPGCLQWLYDAFVTGILLANRGESDVPVMLDGAAARLTGAVEFLPGMNAAVAARADGVLEIADDLGGGTVQRPCWPEDGDEDAPCSAFIRTINGVGPDAGGNFSIYGGGGVEVRNYPELHRIVIDFTKGLSDKTCIV